MRFTPRPLTALALILLATGCGDGGGSGSSSSVPVVSAPAPTPTPVSTPTPSPSPTPTPTPAPSPTPSATPTTWAGKAAALYDAQPDVASCSAGTLKDSVKVAFLSDLNAIRALHNLPAVTYSTSEDTDEANSSLMMAIAKQLSHTPPTSWTCYSASGATGAGSSNLIGGWGTGLPFDSEDDYLGLWLTEGGDSAIGHRRWILSPFLGKTSYGRIAVVLADGTRASAGSMRVFQFAGGSGSVSGVPPFVAYPYHDYPVRYFGVGDYLSFTAISSTTSSSANNAVNFSAATVSVTGPSGAMTVTDITYDNRGYGVPNNIQWRVTGLQTGVTYTVTIAGVTGAPQSSYTYTFRVI